MRKKFSNPLIFILLTSLALNFFFLLKTKKPNRTTAANSVKSTVTRVIDGDTFATENGTRIRLLDIDAPEFPKDCLGEDSKERLKNLIEGKKIQLETFGTDNFGRTLAYVYLDKLSINETMAEEGLAYFEKGKTMTENFMAQSISMR